MNRKSFRECATLSLLIAVTGVSCAKKPSPAPEVVHADAPSDGPLARSTAVPDLSTSGSRPWLDVVLPAPPARAAVAAKVVVSLRDSDPVPSRYAGVRVRFAGAATSSAATEVAIADKAEFPIAASATAPVRLEVGGQRVLAAVGPGDTLSLASSRDGGWSVAVRDRMVENAARRFTRCGPLPLECPVGYLSSPVYAGDPVCPLPASGQADNGEGAHKCVKAPVVRARGPLTGRAEVSEASVSGKFDDLDAVELAPQPLEANAAGAWIAVQIGGDAMPRVRIGDAEAFLIMGPGERWDVWRDGRGQVEARQTTASK